MLYLTYKEAVVMSNEDMKSIFEQINNLKKPVSESREEMIYTGGFVPYCEYVPI